MKQGCGFTPQQQQPSSPAVAGILTCVLRVEHPERVRT